MQPAVRNSYIFFVAGFLLPCLLLFIWFQQWLFLLVPFGLLVLHYCWSQPLVLYILLWASLPWSAEIEFSSLLSMDLPDELLMLAASLFAVVLWLYTGSKSLHKAGWHYIALLLLLHFCWIGITTLDAEYPLISLKFFMAKGWYLAAFILLPLMVLHTKRSLRTAAFVYYTSLVVVVLIIILKHLQLDFLFSSINEAVTPFFRNHVNYAAMIVCSLPVAIVLYHITRRSKYQRLLVTLSVIILLAGIFLAYSRGAWLALVVGIIAYALLQYKLLWQSYMLAIVLVAASFFWLKNNDRYVNYAHDYQTTVFHPDLKEHLTATYKLKDISTAERFYRWIAAIRMSSENPVTGTGPGSFSLTYKPYTVPLFKTWVSNNPEKSTAHNYYLLLLVEQGIPGLLIFIALTIAFFYYVQRLFHTIRDPFYREVLRAIAVMMVMILVLNFLSDLVETDKIGSLFFTCFALLLIIDRKVANTLCR